MTRRILISSLASVLIALAPAAPVHAQCEDLSALNRVVEVVSAAEFTRDTGQLTLLGHELTAALAAVDMARVRPILRAEFQFSRSGWIDQAMQDLDDVALVARRGNIDALQSLTQQTSLTVSLARFQLSSDPSQCATDDPARTPDDHTDTVDTFDTASFSSPIGELLTRAASGPLVSLQVASERGIAAPSATTLLAIPLLVLLIGGGLLILRANKRKAVSLANQRKTPRHACSHPTMVRKLRPTGLNRMLDQEEAETYDATPSRLLDINRFGVSIAQTDPAFGEEQIEFLIGDTWVTGQIRWSNQSCFGVQALDPIDDALVAVVTAAQTPPPPLALRPRRLSFS